MPVAQQGIPRGLAVHHLSPLPHRPGSLRRGSAKNQKHHLLDGFARHRQLFADPMLELPESHQRSEVRAGFAVLAGIYLSFLLEWLLYGRHEHSLEGTAFGCLKLMADAIHNFTDGAIIGVSYLVSIVIGASTTIAIIAHEILDEPFNLFCVALYGLLADARSLLQILVRALRHRRHNACSYRGFERGRFSDLMLPFAAGGVHLHGRFRSASRTPEEASLQKSMLQLAAISHWSGNHLVLETDHVVVVCSIHCQYSGRPAARRSGSRHSKPV